MVLVGNWRSTCKYTSIISIFTIFNRCFSFYKFVVPKHTTHDTNGLMATTKRRRISSVRHISNPILRRENPHLFFAILPRLALYTGFFFNKLNKTIFTLLEHRHCLRSICFSIFVFISVSSLCVRFIRDIKYAFVTHKEHCVQCFPISELVQLICRHY